MGGAGVCVGSGDSAVLVGAARVLNAMRVRVAWANIAAWVCMPSKLKGLGPIQPASITPAASNTIPILITFLILAPKICPFKQRC
jgi:hypothetical protein